MKRQQQLPLDSSSPGLTAFRPPLKWAGGKRWQVPHLIPYWQPHRSLRLVEPFCGGLAVVGGLAAKSSVLNDINQHLINFYRCLKLGLVIELQMENKETDYYRARERFNQLILSGDAESTEGASLFYYLNRTGYNGLCRFNSRGLYNVPFGRYSKINYTVDFSDYAERLSGWDFTNQDFEAMKLQSSDFVYADPPYDVPFTTYSRGGFTWDDQVRLAHWLADHNGPVVLANQATDRILELYRDCGFSLTFLDAPRRISCDGDRTPAKEVLALRNLA